MSLEADMIVDRRRLKRHLTAWRLLAIAVAVGLVVAVAAPFTGFISGKHVALLDVDGIIIDDPWRENALKKIAEDGKAKALIVRIDSPGGTVVGGEALYHSLRRVADKKPVVAVMGQVTTSAGYMVAIAAEHIVAREGTITGSIGVILQTADVTGLLEKLGVKSTIVKSRPLKAQPNPLESFTEEARQATRVVVLDLYDMFVDLVSERRKIDREQVLKLADGRIFTGRQAVGNGLIDAIGGLPKARTWLSESHGIATSLPVKDVKIDYETESWRDLISGYVGKTLFSERLRLDGLISLWHPESW
ncbi:MAG: signal peptide peptidase SppA [Rhodospirillales bacterium]|nr:signal peptide peptidase SppA [Rhodospirillales bacterium]